MIDHSNNGKLENEELWENGGSPRSVAEFQGCIARVSEYQSDCEKEGKYVEAEQAKAKAKQLKHGLIQLEREQIRVRQLNDKFEVEQAQIEEFDQFNRFWENKMSAYDQQANRIIQELVNRQNFEAFNVHEELQKITPVKPKQSSEILNLIKIEEKLAKQQNYAEALLVQIKLQQLQKKENDQWLSSRNEKIQKQLVQLKKYHTNELKVLEQRVHSGKLELKKGRSIELNRLLQKYQNENKELMMEQKIEKKYFEKQAQSQGRIR